jgi:zinc protease
MASGDRAAVLDGVRQVFGARTIAALGESELLARFLKTGDEASFEAILDRHGPMVLGVCRRILDDSHDADDAFQATFLVLIKKARSIRDHAVLGTWLHGVARRVAVRAKVNARRRSAHERSKAEGASVGAGASSGGHAESKEARAVIDEEIGRLPERYRAPIVLCDLQGESVEAASARLGCPVGTVKSRLSRGREQLRLRLARRGFATSAALLGSLLASDASAAVPVVLRHQTLAAAKAIAAGAGVSGIAISAKVLSLTNGVARSMTLSLTKTGTIAALAVALPVTFASLFAFAGKPRPPAEQEQSRVQQPPSGRSGPAQARVADAPKSAPIRDPKATHFELANGLKVILRPIAGAKGTALVVLYSLGEDHDPKGRSGLGHFVEHVYLTAAAGASKARTVEEMMGRYPEGANGQTGARYTLFTTLFPATALDDELKDAAARMSDLHLAQADLERERPRLIEELDNMYSRFPALAVMNHVRHLVLPLADGGRKGGSKEQVDAITLGDLQTHWKRFYKPNNAIVSLAGELDPVAARKAIEASFGKLQQGEQPPPPVSYGRLRTGELREIKTPRGQPNDRSMAGIGYRAPMPNDELYAAFLVQVMRLHAAFGSFTAQTMMPPVHFTPVDDPEILSIAVPTTPGESPNAAVGRIQKVVQDSTLPKLGRQEALGVRNQFAMFFDTGGVPDNLLAQNPYGVAFSLGRNMQMGIDSAKLIQSLDSVTDDELQRVRQQILIPAQSAGAFVSVTN